MRYFFPGIGAIAGLILVCAVSLEATERTPPNILFIMADGLGYGDLGCYGQKHIQTPNLDHMAAQGMRFAQHYSCCESVSNTRVPSPADRGRLFRFRVNSCSESRSQGHCGNYQVAMRAARCQ